MITTIIKNFYELNHSYYYQKNDCKLAEKPASMCELCSHTVAVCLELVGGWQQRALKHEKKKSRLLPLLPQCMMVGVMVITAAVCPVVMLPVPPVFL